MEEWEFWEVGENWVVMKCRRSGGVVSRWIVNVIYCR